MTTIKVKDVPIWIRYTGNLSTYSHAGRSRYGRKNHYRFTPGVWKPILIEEDVTFFRIMDDKTSYIAKSNNAPVKTSDDGRRQREDIPKLPKNTTLGKKITDKVEAKNAKKAADDASSDPPKGGEGDSGEDPDSDADDEEE